MVKMMSRTVVIFDLSWPLPAFQPPANLNTDTHTHTRAHTQKYRHRHDTQTQTRRTHTGAHTHTHTLVPRETEGGTERESEREREEEIFPNQAQIHSLPWSGYSFQLVSFITHCTFTHSMPHCLGLPGIPRLLCLLYIIIHYIVYHVLQKYL